MLSNEELIELEKKYFNILKDILSANLGKIISQICSQKLFEDLTENEKNMIPSSMAKLKPSKYQPVSTMVNEFVFPILFFILMSYPTKPLKEMVTMFMLLLIYR